MIEFDWNVVADSKTEIDDAKVWREAATKDVKRRLMLVAIVCVRERERMWWAEDGYVEQQSAVKGRKRRK